MRGVGHGEATSRRRLRYQLQKKREVAHAEAAEIEQVSTLQPLSHDIPSVSPDQLLRIASHHETAKIRDREGNVHHQPSDVATVPRTISSAFMAKESSEDEGESLDCQKRGRHRGKSSSARPAILFVHTGQ